MKKITLLVVILLSLLGFSQDNKAKIQNYLNQNSIRLNLSNQDINNWFVESTGNSESTKIDTYWIKQQYQGIEIHNALSNVWIKNDEIINIQNGFISNVIQKVNTTTPSLSVLGGLQKGLVALNEVGTTNQILETISTTKFKISNGALSEDPIFAKLEYFVKKDKLLLSWNYTLYTQDFKHLWDISIDAVNGELLSKKDMVISCDFESKNNNQETNLNSFYSSKSLFKDETASLPAQIQGGSYRVIPFNYESPNHHSRDLIVNPENVLASPKGWHDTNTLTGTNASFKYNYLRGNNVWARSDYGNTNPTSASTTSTATGYSPTSASLTFDYAYPGTGAVANTYIDAATTNLFYMNNVVHDLFYQYGFNEINGNYQQTNYTPGATAADYVYADAQDGSSAATPTLNNANFSAPVDGQKGRMQMYLWNVAPRNKPLFVTAPTSIIGNYISRQNGFSPGHVDLPIAPAFLQSDLVLYDDGTPDPGSSDNADACGAAVNAAAINGKIVLIRRSLATASGGTPCNFTVKVKNAQLAGAIAVIVYNNIDVLDGNGNPADVALGMSGADASITIPAIGVSKIVGDLLTNQLASGPVTVKLQLPAGYTPFVNSDGDFDNGVIAHEFGHGISIRLAGGRNNSSCLQNEEQMGEGWSDWFALELQMKPGDIGSTPRGIGTFVFGDPTTGNGIRNYPYSTDMSINPETFNTVNLNQVTDANGGVSTEVHNVGEVWTTMLWDLTWAYVAKYGYDDNKYNGTGGNNKVMRLVLDAIKLQPCSPTFVEARDAIIATDQATTGGQDYCMIWQVFARRGLGVNADSGSRDSSVDEIEDFTQPAAGPNCTLTANYFENQELFKVYPNPSNGLYNIHISKFIGQVTMQVLDINGRVIYSDKNVDFNEDKTIDISAFQTGVYILKINGDNLNYSQKLLKN